MRESTFWLPPVDQTWSMLPCCGLVVSISLSTAACPMRSNGLRYLHRVASPYWQITDSLTHSYSLGLATPDPPMPHSQGRTRTRRITRGAGSLAVTRALYGFRPASHAVHGTDRRHPCVDRHRRCAESRVAHSNRCSTQQRSGICATRRSATDFGAAGLGVQGTQHQLIVATSRRR